MIPGSSTVGSEQRAARHHRRSVRKAQTARHHVGIGSSVPGVTGELCPSLHKPQSASPKDPTQAPKHPSIAKSSLSTAATAARRIPMVWSHPTTIEAAQRASSQPDAVASMRL
ncbi:hypothetical protein VDGL01_08806 [Verticillium dahliae]